MEGQKMREFWDERARENALFFVDSRLDYGSPDADQFWADADWALDSVLNPAGAAIATGDTIVEIGCGVGRLTRAISERAAHVIAIDVSPEMLDLARQHNPKLQNVDWRLGDGATLAGIDDGGIDGVVSQVVFQHIPDPQITLGYVREIGRALRPGGWAAFQISNQPDIHRRRRGARDALLRARAVIGRAPKGQAHPAWRGSAVDLDDLRAAAADGGMTVEQVAGQGTQYCYVRTVKATA